MYSSLIPWLPKDAHPGSLHTLGAALILPLLSILLFVTPSSPTVTSVEFNLAKCIFSKAALDRFHPRFLEHHCSKRISWIQNATRGAAAKNRSPETMLTTRQYHFFQQTSGCSDLNCICDQNSWCRMERRQRHRRQSTPSNLKKALRKEYRMLSNWERYKFHQALNKLKFNEIDGISKYNIMVSMHTGYISPEAHFGPAFLPYHREMLKNLEVALRAEDPDTAIPYWDPSLDSPLPSPQDSILWSDMFLGNSTGNVTEGFMANWQVHPNPNYTLGRAGSQIIRSVAQSPWGSIYKDNDIGYIKSKDKYEQLTWCVNDYFELIHGSVHTWVGGQMAELEIAANDPIFFLLHNFVDCLWEEFRQTKQNRTERETDYVDSRHMCSSVHQLDSQMVPFKMTVREGFSNSYTDNLYEFALRPTCAKNNTDCGSEFLFCDTRASVYRCVSKVRLGGNCVGFEDEDICYNSKCKSSKCQ